jgi:hypothetical protein
MPKFGIALLSALFATFLLVSSCALAEKAQEDKKKDCREQVNPKSVGIGIGQIGFGQGKSDEQKASAKDCPLATQAKNGKTVQQNK